jgi:hypothetical protein
MKDLRQKMACSGGEKKSEEKISPASHQARRDTGTSQVERKTTVRNVRNNNEHATLCINNADRVTNEMHAAKQGPENRP